MGTQSLGLVGGSSRMVLVGLRHDPLRFIATLPSYKERIVSAQCSRSMSKIGGKTGEIWPV